MVATYFEIHVLIDDMWGTLRWGCHYHGVFEQLLLRLGSGWLARDRCSRCSMLGATHPPNQHKRIQQPNTSRVHVPWTPTPANMPGNCDNPDGRPPEQQTIASFFSGGNKKRQPTAATDAASSTSAAAAEGPTIPPTADAEPHCPGLAEGANGSAASPGLFLDGDIHVAPNYSDDDADSSPRNRRPLTCFSMISMGRRR